MPPHLDDNREKVRDRFTRTAEQFARFSLTTRAEEAQILVNLTAPRGDERALDLACGPGTFTRAFAPRVKFVLGIDLTPAILAQAREAAAKAALPNIAFVLGDATRIPLPEGSVELAVCAYSLHHFPDPEAVLRDLVRVVATGGYVALVDIVAPEEPARAATNNAIERARDPSHMTTLRQSDLRHLLQSASLRLRGWQVTERLRGFDEWMQIAGWKRGDPAYEETQRRMEAAMPRDQSGFHARLVAGEIEWVQTSAFLVAERLT